MIKINKVALVILIICIAVLAVSSYYVHKALSKSDETSDRSEKGTAIFVPVVGIVLSLLVGFCAAVCIEDK